MSGDSGSVVTVEGCIDPESLGVTLPHEHVFHDGVDAWFSEPRSSHDRRLAREPVSIETLSYVRRHPMQHRDNMRLDSLEEAMAELRRFHRAGGDAVVDVTPKHLGDDPERVRGVARETGLTVVHGTAYYTRSIHPPHLADADAETVAEEFVSDVETGIDDTDVRAGIVGEIGLSGRIHDREETVLRGAARAARRTGAPLSVHPPGRTPHSQKDRTYPTSRWGLDVLDVVEAEGLAPERVALCHMDRTLYEDPDYQREIARRGAYVEYDLWGTEYYHEEFDDGYPSDARRIELVTDLIDDGHADRLLFSHDICTKIQRTAYGGHGYAHLLENVVPMLTGRGLARDTVEGILADNPRRLLTFDAPG
jgi:phosphotriesterase-related protein